MEEGGRKKQSKMFNFHVAHTFSCLCTAVRFICKNMNRIGNTTNEGGCQIHLYGDLGVKDLLAESAVVQDKCVHVQ